MIATLRKCLRMLPASMHRRWLLLIPLALLTSTIEMVTAGAIFALLLMLTDPVRAGQQEWLQGALSFLPHGTAKQAIVSVAGSLAVIYVAKAALQIWAQYLRHRVSQNSNSALAAEMFRRYLTAPYPFHFQRNSAELIRNCTTSVAVVLGGVLGSVLGLITDLLLAGGLIAMLFAASPGASMLAALGLLGIMVVVLRLTRVTAARLGTESHELGMTVLKGLQQALGSIKEVKLLGREQYFYDDFIDGQARLLRLGLLGITLGSVPAVVVQTVLVCGGLTLIVLLTLLGQSGPELLPIAGVFGYAGLRILPLSNAVVSTINSIRSNRCAVDELYDDYVTLGALPERSAADAVRFTEAIELHDIAYAYPGADRRAVHGVSLKIRLGESIGIVGATGAGKSTLADLILGLLMPTAGRITVDGVDLGGSATPWHRRVGYVPQAVFMIDDSLRRNIALGIRPRDVDDDRIRTVLEMVQLGHFAIDLPEGLDTRLGERGIRLSGGERQRVAIARALYHDPDLIVFDEATSNLDVATEAEVAAAIEGLQGLKTVIIITHRLSTVQHCDRVVWLRAGRVEGVGPFEDLRSGDERFRELTTLASL